MEVSEQRNPASTGDMEKSAVASNEHHNNKEQQHPTEENVEQQADTQSQLDVCSQSEDHPNTWRNPRQNLFRLISVYYGFIIFGMSDSSIGVLLPRLEEYYDINYLVASVAFVAPFCGYIVAALCSDFIHRKIGRWGISILGTGCQLVCYIICLCKPPFPVYVIAYGIAGLGNGTIEAGWNAWGGSLDKANSIMGFLHGFYGLGGIMCPSIFTAILETGREWNICYSVMVSMSAVSVALAIVCWWNDRPSVYIDEMDENKEGNKDASIKVAMKNKLVWTLAILLFMYVGCEVSIGGWLTTYMIEIRHGDSLKMGYVTTGFWTGLTIGRVLLGFVTEYFHHEEISLAIYLGAAVGLLIVFWVVNVMVVSAVAIALVGFFIGPAFPIIVVVAMKKLPKWLHVSGIGFSSAVGGSGAALLPFINGIISEKVGPKVLGPYAFSLLAALLLGWMFVVFGFKK